MNRFFLITFLLLSFTSYGQNDSLKNIFNGLDFGLSITPNIYQRQKVVLTKGDNYFSQPFKPSFEAGILFSKNLFKGKIAISTGLKVGLIPLDEYYFIPKEEVLIYYPENVDTRRFGGGRIMYTMDYIKIPLTLTRRKRIGKKVFFAEIGGHLKWHYSTSFGHYGLPLTTPNYDFPNSNLDHPILYIEFEGPKYHWTFDNSLQIGTYYTFLNRFILKPSIYINFSYSKIINAPFRFFGIIPTSEGIVYLRQSFIGLNIDILYIGKK